MESFAGVALGVGAALDALRAWPARSGAIKVQARWGILKDKLRSPGNPGGISVASLLGEIELRLQYF